MNQQTYRGDRNLGRYGSVFGRYTHAYYNNHTLYNSSSVDYGIEEYIQTEDAWEVSHTISFGGKNVNNFRFGKLRAQAPEGSAPVPASVVSALGRDECLHGLHGSSADVAECSPRHIRHRGWSRQFLQRIR